MSNTKKIIIAITIFSIVILILYFCYGLFFKEDVIFTSDIEDYNTSEYPLAPFVFPDQIPKNAKVKEFSYYEFYHEDRDEYLELSFETKEELEKYCEEFLETAKNKLIDKGSKTYHSDWFITESNPHDNSYTDIFFTTFYVWKENDYFTGYKVKGDRIEMNSMGILSYSYKDLVVIHSYSSGTFTSENDYIPKYIKRFNVNLQKEYSRVIYLDSEDE